MELKDIVRNVAGGIAIVLSPVIGLLGDLWLSM